MIRSMALLCVFAVSAGIGFLRGRSYRARIQRLRELQQMLLFFEGELQYGNPPLAQLFERTGQRLPPPFSAFLQGVAKELRQRKGKRICEIFSQEIEAHLKHTELSPGDFGELKRLGTSLGSTDRDTQLRSLGLYSRELAQKLVILQEELPNRLRLCQSLGVMGGLFLVLLLL